MTSRGSAGRGPAGGLSSAVSLAAPGLVLLSHPGHGRESVLAVLLGAGGYAAYIAVTRRSVRSRRIDTALPPDQVRRLFVELVTGWGWRVVETGDPLVAQSTLLTGRRQRIGLTVRYAYGRTVADVDVQKYAGQWVAFPVRPHTIRWRVNGFLDAVRAADPSARVRW